MVTLAALFAAAAAAAGYSSFAAFRWGELKRFWLFLGAIIPLAVLAVALLWIGIGYPRLDERLAGQYGLRPGMGLQLRRKRWRGLPAQAAASMPPSTAEQKTP